MIMMKVQWGWKILTNKSRGLKCTYVACMHVYVNSMAEVLELSLTTNTLNVYQRTTGGFGWTSLFFDWPGSVILRGCSGLREEEKRGESMDEMEKKCQPCQGFHRRFHTREGGSSVRINRRPHVGMGGPVWRSFIALWVPQLTQEC